MIFKTFMWQECNSKKNNKTYRFQTNDSSLKRIMQRRNDFKLVLWGVKDHIWVYKTKRKSLKNAKRTLKRLTGSLIKYDAKNDVFFSLSGSKLIVKK